MRTSSPAATASTYSVSLVRLRALDQSDAAAEARVRIINRFYQNQARQYFRQATGPVHLHNAAFGWRDPARARLVEGGFVVVVKVAATNKCLARTNKSHA